jgi:tetratricopeptide (TPR) repeat protein
MLQPQAPQDQDVDDESVRHLVELGYIDPHEASARQAARRRQLQAELDRARDLRAQGQVAQAVALLDELAAEDPDWAAPHERLAEVHYGAGRWSGAQAALDWLAHHGYEHPRYALIAGGIALARRDLHAALEELLFAWRVMPELPSIHTLLGSVLFRLARLDEAEDAFREAAQQNPNDARARDGLAAICLKHGEYEEAADWALRALEQDMQLFRAHYHLGLALAHLNRPEEALLALEASARVDGTRTAPYYWLSRIAIDQLHDSHRSRQYRERGRQILRDRRAQRGRQ